MATAQPRPHVTSSGRGPSWPTKARTHCAGFPLQRLSKLLVRQVQVCQLGSELSGVTVKPKGSN